MPSSRLRPEFRLDLQLRRAFGGCSARFIEVPKKRSRVALTMEG